MAAKKTKQINKQAPRTIYNALADFKNEKIIIPRNGNGKTKTGQPYKYATLDDVINITQPFLQTHGLVFSQIVVGAELKTSLVYIHAGAEPKQLDSMIPLGNPSSAQDMGARITYMRRYALVPILGLSIEEDTDAVPPTLDEKVTDAIVDQVAALKPIVNNSTPIQSESYKKAYDAIQSCQNEAALVMINDRLKASERLTEAEKAELVEVLKLKETEVLGTIH